METLRSFKTGASGLEQLKAVVQSGHRAGIAQSLLFDLTEVSDGSATFSGTPDARSCGPFGTVHSGYASTLLDSACACAVQTKLSAEQAYTTLELKVLFHRPITTSTGPVHVIGRVLSLNIRAAFAAAELVDVRGDVYVSATSTLLVFER